jgi:hypothetical protein
MRQQRRLYSIFTFAFGLTFGLWAASSEVLSAADTSVRDGLIADTTAKYLAGMAVPAISAEAPEADSPWRVHSRELDRTWKRTEEQQLPAIANWTADFVNPLIRDPSRMFYMFSGPDFLYAQAFCNNARTYILCGREPVGEIPDLNTIPPQELSATLANLRKSLDSVLSWSFFITKNMKLDLTQTRLTGTLPILFVFLARTGCTIDSVTLVALDRAGNLVENTAGEVPGVRIAIIGPSGLSQTVCYFCTDLSNDGIKSKPSFLRFCEKQGRGVSLLKAASYLLHESAFSRVRDFLLTQSDIILQDDSGIPLRYFANQDWALRYCGRYLGPISVFKQYWQPDLADAYAHSVPAPLPFGFGYQWQPNHSDVMIAARANSASAAYASAKASQLTPPIIEQESVDESWESNASGSNQRTVNDGPSVENQHSRR